MPELPEVEIVRQGLELGIVGRTIAHTQVLHPRAVRRQPGGSAEFVGLLQNCQILAAHRRGKYLWLPLSSGDFLVGHLGMSGQLVLTPPELPDEIHLRVRIQFSDPGNELHFVDQRTFGGLLVEPGNGDVPATIAHIARDPLDPDFDDDAFAAALRRRRTGLKRALLDQTLMSGVGNIYADEALWRAKLHWARATETLRRPQINDVLAHLRAVLTESLAGNGTTFDGLYVNVNGESGQFSDGLKVYGREGQPCLRCGALIRREPFMNRSSFRCPHCQRQPAQVH